MLAKLLAPKIAGAIGGTLLAICLALGVFAFVQTTRLSSAKETIEAQYLSMAGLGQAANNATTAAAQKDAVIKQQSAALEDILKTRWQDRQAYLANYAAADGRARSNDARSASLINLKASGGELEVCRAARALLEKELTE